MNRTFGATTFEPSQCRYARQKVRAASRTAGLLGFQCARKRVISSRHKTPQFAGIRSKIAGLQILPTVTFVQRKSGAPGSNYPASIVAAFLRCPGVHRLRRENLPRQRATRASPVGNAIPARLGTPAARRAIPASATLTMNTCSTIAQTLIPLSMARW
jgi:hypothetical protein